MPLSTDSAERKAAPIFSGLLRYFPDACAEVARLSKVANEKHNPGQPMHWSRGKSDDHGDCIVRHQVDAGTLDEPETPGGPQFLHDAKVAWRALAQLQLALEKQRAEAAPADDAPFKAGDRVRCVEGRDYGERVVTAGEVYRVTGVIDGYVRFLHSGDFGWNPRRFVRA